MNLKVYEKTRYQNIYRHKKNKNLIIRIKRPIDTSICDLDGIKIYDINQAIKIRNEYAKSIKIKKRGTVPIMWQKYEFYCENVKKLRKRTLKKKYDLYNKYIQYLCPNKQIIKISQEDIASFFTEDIFNNTSDKEKNEILRQIKAFFNWALDNKHIHYNPAKKINEIPVEKKKIEFWTVDDFIKFKNTVEEDLKSLDKKIKYKANIVNILSCIGMCIGDRIGETRALSFKKFDKQQCGVEIDNDLDIDYSISTTKTYSSQRFALAPPELFEEVDNYKLFLKEELNLEISEDTLLFFNHENGKPFNDATLRKYFNYYIKKAEVPRITMYQLRHSYVANMLEQGYELYHVSSNIGHADYATTMNFYGGLSNSIKRKIANASSNIFRKT